jgi:chemotaxis protein CheD
MQRTIGISEMWVSAEPNDVLVTYSLGSCVGVSMYDSQARVGGMIHCMLPSSSADPDKARQIPEMFMDTGVPALIDAIVKKGGSPQRIVAKVAGAAAPLSRDGVFQIGPRNFEALRNTLAKSAIPIAGQDVGGSVARTLLLYMNSGRTTVRCGGVEKEL